MELTREVVVDAGIDEVWAALTESDQLSEWIGADVSFDPRPGGLGEFVEGPSVKHAVVETVEEGRRLAFRWWSDGTPDSVSVVEFAVERRDTGTAVRVTERLAAGAATVCSLRDATLAWDDRLLGLELKCLARVSVGAS